MHHQYDTTSFKNILTANLPVLRLHDVDQEDHSHCHCIFRGKIFQLNKYGLCLPHTVKWFTAHIWFHLYIHTNYQQTGIIGCNEITPQFTELGETHCRA